MSQSQLRGKGIAGRYLLYVSETTTTAGDLFLKSCFRAVLMVLAISQVVGAQTTDTLYTPRPLIRGADAFLILGFVAATAAAEPLDKYFTQKLQDPARQSNIYL